MHGIEHGDDIFDWRPRLDVVNRVKDESTARREDLAPAQNLFPNLSRRSKGQNPLRIHSAAPEDDLVAKVRFQLLRFHSGCGTLHGIENVEASFDKGGEEL
jgi:hypothetical protein